MRIAGKTKNPSRFNSSRTGLAARADVALGAALGTITAIGGIALSTLLVAGAYIADTAAYGVVNAGRGDWGEALRAPLVFAKAMGSLPETIASNAKSDFRSAIAEFRPVPKTQPKYAVPPAVTQTTGAMFKAKLSSLFKHGASREATRAPAGPAPQPAPKTGMKI